MAGADGGIDLISEFQGRRRCQHPVGFADEADAQGESFDGLKTAFQDRSWSVVSAHAVDGNPESVAVVDVRCVVTPLQTPQRIEHQRLQHAAGHRSSNVAGGIGGAGGTVNQRGHGGIAPIPDHQSADCPRPAVFAPGPFGRGGIRTLRSQRSR